jgi:hypothetical protein
LFPRTILLCPFGDNLNPANEASNRVRIKLLSPRGNASDEGQETHERAIEMEKVVKPFPSIRYALEEGDLARNDNAGNLENRASAPW